MKAHDLVARFAKAGESANPMNAAREELDALRNDVAAIESALAYVSGTGGNARQVFYRSPTMTLLKVCFPAGRRTPPHNHGTWAQILLLSGEEKNTLYRTDGGTLKRASEVTRTRGAVLPMMADTAHVAECLGSVPAIGLHVYGGDILELPRQMWNPQTLQAHPLDWTVYETFAQAASKAASAPLT
jgi:predicted metal-dependent enzyme (double-stranded beta helix superfamily)